MAIGSSLSQLVLNKILIKLHLFYSSKLEWEHKGKVIVSSLSPQHARYKRMSNRFNRKNRKRRKRQVIETSEDGVLNIHRIVKEEHGDLYTCIVYSPSGEMARRYVSIYDFID